MNFIEKPAIKNYLLKNSFNIIKKDYLWFFFFVFLLTLLLLLQKRHLPDIDLYFHIKIADILKNKFYIYNLPWMSYSIHAERYTDYHYLFHWLLVPFSLIGKNLILSAKIATAFYISFSILALGILLEKLHIKYRWFWMLFFIAASPGYTVRLLFGKGLIVFIPVIFLFIYLIVNDRKKSLFFLSWLSVWMYPGFIILIIFLIIYTSADFIKNSNNKNFFPNYFIFSLAGFLFGFLLHPSFPAQFKGFWTEIVLHSMKPKGIELIMEWLQPNYASLKTVLLLPVFFLFLRFLKIKNHSVLESALLIISFFILFASFGSLKFFEYLLPFLTLYLALNKWDDFPKSVLALISGITIMFTFFWSGPYINGMIKDKMNERKTEMYFEAADWLKEKTQKNTLVMLHWNEFPEFFYRNTDNRYLFGLNPIYSYAQNRSDYLLIKDFFQGNTFQINEIPALLGAEYIVLNKNDNKKTIDILSLKKIKTFENDKFIIFKS